MKTTTLTVLPPSVRPLASRTLAAHQANYLPNLAFFAKMARAELFVAVGNVQFGKEDGWQRRNRIPNMGKDLWLTVPVRDGMHTKLKDVRICQARDWRQKHIRTLQVRYPQADGSPLMQDLIRIYSQPWERLFDINVALIQTVTRALRLTTPLVIDEEVSGAKHELIINLCRKYGTRRHLAGRGSLGYMDHAYLSRLESTGIQTSFIPTDFTRSYPYSAIHYLLTNGAGWVGKVIAP